MLRFFSYSFPVSDGSEETTAGFRSKEARRARKQKYRLHQTILHSSLLVAHQGDVSRKLNQAKISTMNCRTLISDVRVKELQQLASDMSIDVLAVQDHKRTSLDMHKSLLLPGWQFLLKETPSPGVVGIGFLVTSCREDPAVIILSQSSYWKDCTGCQ